MKKAVCIIEVVLFIALTAVFAPLCDSWSHHIGHLIPTFAGKGGAERLPSYTEIALFLLNNLPKFIVLLSLLSIILLLLFWRHLSNDGFAIFNAILFCELLVFLLTISIIVLWISDPFLYF